MRVCVCGVPPHQEDDCSAAVTFCLSTYGALNIDFNNAGIFASAPFSQISEEMVDSIMGTNVKSVIFCFKYQVCPLKKWRVKGWQ